MNLQARARALTSAADIDTPPGAPLTPGAVQRGLRLSSAEGALSTVYITVTAGVFLTGYALQIGADAFTLGLIGAIPFVSQIFQFVGAYLEERYGERRRLILLTASISRLLWALIVALPFLGPLGGTRLPLFLLILVASQALIGIAANAWTSWMSDLVPPRQRGRYFGIRNTICSVSAMISAWGAGKTLDAYRGSGDEAIGYALIFGIATLTALAALVVLARQPEPPMQRRQRMPVSELFAAPLRHRAFRALMLTTAGWSMATGIAAPFFNAYGIQNLNLSFATLALMSVVTSAVALITQPLIGRLQDRYSDRLVLIVSVIGVIPLPWGWVFSTHDFLLPLWLTSIFAGVFWPGITQGQLNLTMDRAPAEGRGAYLASFGALSGIGTLVAGVLGGIIATSLAGFQLDLGPMHLNHYSVLFIGSSVLRAIMAIIFVRML